MNIGIERFYTWVDVESKFRMLLEDKRWPKWLQSVSSYSSGVDLSVRDANSVDIAAWLVDIFGPRISKAGESISISMDGYGDKSIQVFIEKVDSDQSRQLKLLFESAMRLSRIRGSNSPAAASDDVPLYAFHSFKGGVGRTTAAMSLALEIAGGKEKNRRVLLIDADMEAPGISFLLEQRVPDLPISFADFLALANDDLESSGDVAVKTVADAVRALDFDGVIVLPAFRGSDAYESIGIRPEHLIRNSRDPFVISYLIRALGRALKVDAIVVDLRAGISEISSGLILDPTVVRVLVTTLGGQSLRGTRSVLGKIARSDDLIREAYPNGEVSINDINIIFSQVREEQKESVLANEINELVSSVVSREEVFDPRISVVDYVGDLSSMSRSWDSCLVQIARSRIGEPLRAIADSLFAKDQSDTGVPDGDIDKRRKSLSVYASRLEYAESGEGDSFLVTAPLRHLASDYSAELPIVATIGQKGAGKSYTYLQLVRQNNWENFVGKIIERPDSIEAPIFPLIEPFNLSGPAQRLTNSARTRLCDRIGTKPGSQSDLRDRIRAGLAEQLHEGQWRQLWLMVMAEAMGLTSADPTAAILDALKGTSSEKVVFAIDGLEDLFQNIHSDEMEQRALRSLLLEVVSWLSQVPGRPVGLVVFVRRDMVLAAVKQNPGQFFHRFLPYELRWDREEALRLVGWVADQSGAVSIAVAEDRSETALAEDLVPLWGLKLGAPESREAHAAEWVLAALSDFKGQVQARDVVRFVKVAAEESMEDMYWTDRVLSPPGLRKAPVNCGREKVSEIEQETPRLKAVFSKLRSLPNEQRRIPFQATEVGLGLEEIELLERSGIVLREPDGYYMPEMFRQGLDFALPKGARPRVLALARRARVGSS